MHERGKSDGPVIPASSPNKAAAAEAGEERGLAKGNTAGKRAPDTAPGLARSVRWIVCAKRHEGIRKRGSRRCCTMSAWSGW